MRISCSRPGFRVVFKSNDSLPLSDFTKKENGVAVSSFVIHLKEHFAVSFSNHINSIEIREGLDEAGKAVFTVA